MTEVFFYHLQGQPLEKALPLLLEKCRERGWSVIVQGASEERLSALDDALWTYQDDSFLPHGTARDGAPETQPILLTTSPDNINSAAVRVLVEGVEPPDLSGLTRVLVLFDGHDDDAVQAARTQWKSLKEQGHTMAYWQQDEGGRWGRKA